MLRNTLTTVSLVSNEENVDNNSKQISITEIDDDESRSNICNKFGDMQPISIEFRQHYEKKLQEICDDNNEECIQAKMKLQEDWIRDLTEQNEMLIKAVIELESEATERVNVLEGKLKESAACACEARESAAAKDRKIEHLQTIMVNNANNRFEESDQFRLMQENYTMLKQTMQDVRDALTAEVADKHDVIVTLRRDVQLLEEQCKRADQQTHFKDDIIKELRKDLKHLKQEMEVHKSKKKPSYSSPFPHITYIPMTTCSDRIAEELQCTAAPVKCEHRKHSISPRNYYRQLNEKRFTQANINEKPELLKNDKKDQFTVVHEHSPKQSPSLLLTSSSYFPSSCYIDKPKRTIFTSVKETVNTARAVVDYLDLTISEGKILSEANRIMKRRQYKLIELEKEKLAQAGDCEK